MQKFHPIQLRATFAGLVFAAGLGMSAAALAGAPIVIEPQMQAEGAAASVPSRHRVTVSAKDLFAMRAGESFSLSIPGHGTPFEIVHDRIETQNPLNSTTQPINTWIGHLKGYTDDYRAIITADGNHSVGRIATPEGNFQIETAGGVTTLTDLDRAGVRLHPFGDDALPSPRAKRAAASGSAQSLSAPVASEVTPAGNSTIDVLVLYNPTFATAVGNAPQGAIANLIAVANQAMTDSQVGVTFRLVATQQLSMSDADSNETLLYKVTYPSVPSDPNLTKYNDPVYSGVPALRDQYGADLVVAIRQFNEPVQISCGIAWTLTELGSDAGITEDAPYAYAVVSYGEYKLQDGSGYVCDQVTMAHEMGHNMGSGHDHAHAPNPPVFTYSYGYGLAASTGVPGFATVMAANYIQAPICPKYSNPALTCPSGGINYVSGVAATDPNNAANNALSLNNTRARVAQFRPTAAAFYTPATGYWWNPAEPGRGYNIEKNGNNLFMAAFLYDQTNRATWYGVGPGAMIGNTFSGTLETFSGGQTLTGAFKQASAGPSAGAFSITFTSATQATITWPGGTVPIQRYDFGPGGSGVAVPAGTPQAGWWFAPTEGGRGYAIEIQGGSMFLAGYMYDTAGNPIWYASGPTPMTSQLAYSGVWQQLGSGQTLTGAYRAPSVVNSNAGSVSILFTSTTTGTLTFPNGRQVTIQRYAF